MVRSLIISRLIYYLPLNPYFYTKQYDLHRLAAVHNTSKRISSQPLHLVTTSHRDYVNMATPLRDQERAKEDLPELKALPGGWLICVDGNKRVCFRSDQGQQTFVHPTFGSLPKPWILRYCRNQSGNQVVRYYNNDNKMSSTQNPRHNEKVLRKQNNSRKEDPLGTAAGFHKMKKGISLDKYKREPVGNRDIRHRYDILKALDLGTGQLGGMNGGVFVVKMKGQERLSVEKRFAESQVNFSQREIHMLHRLRHGSISFYTAGFITPDLSSASVYVEFCDRGSLENLITAYGEHRNSVPNNQKPEVPERFIWHAFAGLCDGLAYLFGGRSYIAEGVTDYTPDPKWIPVLHRDMKPDNVLLRSRETLGSKRYWYCVLSDFGLACEDRPRGHPSEDRYQHLQSQLGTAHYYAPELCYNPYPKTTEETTYFPGDQRHSAKSDLWALGASMYNLADCGPHIMHDGRAVTGGFAHINWSNWYQKPHTMQAHTFYSGTLSRKPVLDVSKINSNRGYSKQLRDAILQATEQDPKKRPSPIKMVGSIKLLMAQAGFHGHVPEGSNDELPSWASKVHDYHSRTPITPSQLAEMQEAERSKNR